MKKEMICFICGILLIGLVFAQSNAVGVQGREPVRVQNIGVQRMQAGNYELVGGQQLQVQALENNRIRLEVGGVGVDCDLNMTQEMIQNKTKLNVKLNNGRNAEVKIMPDSASETALNRLRIKVCSEENNCSIELKEVGQGEETKLAYELKVQKQAKVFGLFKTRMNVQSQVDAESGEIIQSKKPWWAFLASEPEEE